MSTSNNCWNEKVGFSSFAIIPLLLLQSIIRSVSLCFVLAAAFDLMAAAAETTHGPAAEPEKTGKLQAVSRTTIRQFH